MKLLLKNILPFDLFKRMLDEGFIRSQVHPLYPELVIFNYTEAAQFDRVWNEATNICRGLIVRLDGATLTEDAEVVARPFNKFHNLNTEYVPETMEANLQGVPLVTMKLDGSMGVVYIYDGKYWVATRGSFDSDQARWATAWYRQHEAMFPQGWPADVTPVCEIIYPENRIVVDYDFAGLVLLSIIDNETGKELSRFDVEMWGAINTLQVVEKFDKSLAECAAENTSNEEGYVLTYSNGVKVKVKFEEYVRLHRILTGLNPKTVWEMLSQGQSEAIDKLLADPKMPVTFVAWLHQVSADLQLKFMEIELEAQTIFANKPGGIRKDDAIYFVKTAKHLTGVLFKMLDGKSYAETIWDMIKPKILRTFKKDGE
jgi:T4 RnlA family RNA ligase